VKNKEPSRRRSSVASRDFKILAGKPGGATRSSEGLMAQSSSLARSTTEGQERKPTVEDYEASQAAMEEMEGQLSKHASQLSEEAETPISGHSTHIGRPLRSPAARSGKTLPQINGGKKQKKQTGVSSLLRAQVGALLSHGSYSGAAEEVDCDMQ
ncbi:unnamed protein product, partial [Ostreobium quekettii]